MTKECSKCKEPLMFELEDGFICDECKEKAYNDFVKKYQNGAIIDCTVDVTRVVEDPFCADVTFEEIKHLYDKKTMGINKEELEKLTNKLVEEEYVTDFDADIEDIYNVRINPTE